MSLTRADPRSSLAEVRWMALTLLLLSCAGAPRRALPEGACEDDLDCQFPEQCLLSTGPGKKRGRCQRVEAQDLPTRSYEWAPSCRSDTDCPQGYWCHRTGATTGVCERGPGSL